MGGLKLAYSFFIANKVSLNSHYTLLPFHIIYVSITWAHHTYQRDLFASLYAVSFSPLAFLPTMTSADALR